MRPAISFPLALAVFILLPFYSISQRTPPAPAAGAGDDAPAPAADICNGVFLSYRYGSGSKIRPTDPTHQPYRFESTLTVHNNGIEKLKSWQAFAGFKHDDQILVSASNAILADGSSFPALVGNDTVFADSVPDLGLNRDLYTRSSEEKSVTEASLVVGVSDVDEADE